MTCTFFGKTDVGMKRNHNEDAFLIDPELSFAVVADGMGGHAAGEVASELAVERISSFLRQVSGTEDITWPYKYDIAFSLNANKLMVGIKLANDAILSKVAGDPHLNGMGTTIVAALFEEGSSTIAHVGDSRAYLYRKNRLSLLTNDHSWVSEQVRRGLITEEQARVHPMKNVVTQALGGADRLSVEIDELPLEPGDLLLLCSDGLNSMVPGDVLGEIFTEYHQNPEELIDRLIHEANERGGDDNITVVVVREEP
ncbi:MAG: Stp1/IreP family PP2C-type Ser/Thr phosphatase [Acidobacteria bacterium]|nr:MAG: Stp1/IreP family PP2C-type Ser/Thr phosphatase [Acidobacteriota bacterium]